VYVTLGLEQETQRAVERAVALDPMNDLVRSMQRALDSRE
jgi:hypothetical protein